MALGLLETKAAHAHAKHITHPFGRPGFMDRTLNGCARKDGHTDPSLPPRLTTAMQGAKDTAREEMML